MLFILAAGVVWATLKQKVMLTLILGALLSLSMILSWLVWGSLTVVGVALDDMCWSMDMWNVNKTHADITNDVIPCMNPGDAVYSMNVLRYEVYKNIVDMNDKLTAKDETFCTEFYPVPERSLRKPRGMGAAARLEAPCVTPEKADISARTLLSYCLIPRWKVEILCVKTTC